MLADKIFELGLIQKIPHFKKEENKPKVYFWCDFCSFLIDILILAFVYILIEKSFATLKMMTASELLEMYFTEGVYFIMTTATTVGYGDFSPVTILGKIFVMTFLYTYMIMRLMNVLSGFVDARSIVKKLEIEGKLFKMIKNHAILYCDANTIRRDNFIYLSRFITEMQTSSMFRDNPIMIVNDNQDANEILSNFIELNYYDNPNVSILNLNLNNDDFFKKISIKDAAHVFILGNPEQTQSDSNVLDFALRIKEETPYDKKVTAEVTDDKNRKRLKTFGGVDIVMRPNRAYPEMLVSATITPGSSDVIEELISRGQDSLEYFSVPEKEFQFGHLLFKLSMESIGTIVAISYKDGTVDPNPMGVDMIKDAKGVIIMVHEMRNKKYQEIQNDVNEIFKGF